MKSKKILEQKLNVTLQALDGLVKQLRDTQDYSEKSEMLYLMRELVLEQIDGRLQENENTNYSNNSAG